MTRTHQFPAHPHSIALRQRAGVLTDLATAIERLQVTTLGQRAEQAGWRGRRADLAATMLEHNVHQLHRAADDLRSVAFRLRRRADELELARRRAA